MNQPNLMERTDGGAQPSSAYTGYVLFMIFMVTVFNACDRTIVSVMVDDIKADLVLSDRQMGILLGFAFALVHFIVTLPFARLADRWSRPRVIALGLFGWSLMTALGGMAQNFTQLAITRMGVGVGEAAGGPPNQALIAEYVSPEKRGRAMSLITIGGVAGLGFGVMYGGWASQHHGWRFALISVGLPGVLLAILFWLTIVDKRSLSHGVTPPPDLVQTLRALARNRAFVLMTLGACTLGIATYGGSLWAPTFFRRVYGMSATQAGTWFFLTSLVPVALGAACSGYLLDRLTRRDFRWHAWLPAITCTLSVPLYMLFYLISPEYTLGVMPVGIIFLMLASLLAAFWVPPTICLAQALAPPNSLAVTAATWGMLSNFVGYGLGSLLVGDLTQRFEPFYGDQSIKYALLLVTLVYLIAAGLYARTASHLRPTGVAGPC